MIKYIKFLEKLLETANDFPKKNSQSYTSLWYQEFNLGKTLKLIIEKHPIHFALMRKINNISSI